MRFGDGRRLHLIAMRHSAANRSFAASAHPFAGLRLAVGLVWFRAFGPRIAGARTGTARGFRGVGACVREIIRFVCVPEGAGFFDERRPHLGLRHY